MYKVLFSQKAEKQLDKLERKTAERVTLTLERIIIRPQAYVKRLVGCPYYSLRVGDYRLFVDYYEGKDHLIIRAIRHRKDAYKR